MKTLRQILARNRLTVFAEKQNWERSTWETLNPGEPDTVELMMNNSNLPLLISCSPLGDYPLVPIPKKFREGVRKLVTVADNTRSRITPTTITLDVSQWEKVLDALEDKIFA